MPPGIERPKHEYEQVAERLRQEILSGELAPGDKVRSARQLAQDFGVNPNTAHRALAVLRSAGLTEVHAGKGTFVKQPRAGRSAQDHLHSIRNGGRIYPKNEYARILAADLVAAPDHVAEALTLNADAPVIRRQRVTFDESERKVSASTSWFDGRFAATSPALLVAERMPEGTPAYIERTRGVTISSGRDETAAEPATAADAELLGVEEGSPVRHGRNWMYGTDGEVIEFGESVAVAGRWASYSYQIQPEPKGG